MKRMMALMALMTLTACDGINSREREAERSDGSYQAAMADYQSGRLQQAVDGFLKIVRESPDNASARFQLACLLHEFKHDYIGAFCAYQEYLLQEPNSDKAQLASDRMLLCEREMAKQLSVKYGIGGGSSGAEISELIKGKKAADDRAAILEKEVASLRAKIDAVSGERERLLKMIKGEEETDIARQSIPKNEAALLDEDAEETDRVQMSADAKTLLSEEGDEISASSALLPKQDLDAKRKRDEAELAAKSKSDKIKTPSHPSTYVVQEGDTLYKIAIRFYGHSSAWSRIRDANKATISTDGRINYGDTIVLP